MLEFYNKFEMFMKRNIAFGVFLLTRDIETHKKFLFGKSETDYNGLDIWTILAETVYNIIYSDRDCYWCEEKGVTYSRINDRCIEIHFEEDITTVYQKL